MNVFLSSADCFRVDASTKPESKDFNLDDIAAPDVTPGLLGVGFGRSWLSRYSLSMEPKELPATGERLLPFMTGNVVVEHLHRYAIAGQFATGRDVLDIASGEGYGSHLLSLNARSVVGVDISPETISHARARYERPNLTFREGCCAAIPLPDASVDLVVSFETIEHIQEHTWFLAEVVRVLRKGGQMIISTPEARCDGATKYATNPYHLRELSLAEFEALLRLHFAHVRLYGQRTVHASAILGIDEVGPQKCGVFTGDFHATEFSNKLPRPAYMLAFCSDSSLPGIPVGHFELKGRTANDAFWSEACQIQVFADQGAGYTEALSVRQSLIPEVWQCIRFEHLERLHTDCQLRLRIDLVNQPALIEVAGIRITRDADGAVLYEASSASEFRRLEFSANALTYFEGWALVVLATDADPQLYLPLLPDFHGSACTLEVNLRMNTSVPGLLCRLHQFEGNHRALAAVAEDLRMQVARLKTSETAWKQLHSEDHAKLESTESHARNLEGELSVARSESAERQRALDVARDESAERQRALNAARGESAERQRALNAARGESAERQRALNAARGEAAERQRALETVRNELAAAAAELCGIKSSAEWRLSAPLRWIGSFATRKICSAGKRCAEIREWFARIGMRFSRGYRLRRVRGDCELIRKSGLVGANWYFTRYPAARRGKPDPVNHYVREGVAKGFDPSPLFDTSSYLERSPDVAKAGQNPLAHYLRTGAAEGRDPNPLFDTRWYLEQNPDVASSGENPLAHYARIGAAEGRDPNPLFDSDWYLSQNPDVAAAGCNPLSHYLDCGWREGRDPGPHFDGSYYLKHYLDVAAKGANPLVHFIRYGWSEGRSPGVRFDLHPNSAGDGGAQASEIRLLAEYLNQRAGFGNAASGSVAGRGGDWDLFHKAPKEIGWRKRLAKVPDRRLPVISVVMPVYRTPLALLERTVLSVITQEYPKWELCIADDGSGDESLREWLESRALGDSRIKLTISDHNRGISAATNAALALCTGDFVALLDHDDELTPDALGEVAGVLAEHPETDAVYSDQDKMDGSGRRYQPFHKPAWSPVFFLGVMYVGHLLVIRRDVMESVRGCDTRFDKVQDYELMLRVSEVTDRIRHIPKILYHWRAITGSVAASHSAKGSIEELQAAAVAAHLRRRKIAAEAVSHPRHAHRVLLEPATDQLQPAISIIIPTAGDSPTLGVCLASIVEKTTYAEYEILLVVRKDPNRTDVQNRNLAAARGIARVRVLEYDFPFNYSRVNNFAADVACGTMLVFLNDDTSVITSGWLESMATHLSLPRVGAVGPRLLYPDGSVQHAGVVLGFRGTADHVMRGFPCDADGYFGSLCVSREVSAVTGACLMTRADTFRSVGGMRECYASVYQDVDLCLRIRQSGHSIIYVANVELVHHESTTRGSGYDRVDREILIDRWREELAADPCYNANFTRNRHDYTLKWAQS